MSDKGLFFYNLDWVQFRTFPPVSTAASVAYARGLLYYPSFLDVPTLAARSTTSGSPLAARGGTMGEK
jgi:hypothetical protein